MRCVVVLFSVFYMFLAADVASADQRIALVVGNGAYKNVQHLPNPPISAKAMAGLLRKAGFDVIEGTDLKHEQMTERLLEFGRKAQGADLAVFYYSGQAIAINGIEYLLPVDANIKSEMDIKLGGAVNVDVALDQTMSDAKVKLAFLDASRDNPFAARIPSATTASNSVSIKPGLAEMKSADNSLTVFATGSGQAAPDGPAGTVRPLTRALIANIAAPGVEIQEAMTKVRAQVSEETKGKQMSWGHSNLSGAVYLNPLPSPSSPPAGAK
jgi:uncharacterized caspase-like protein